MQTNQPLDAARNWTIMRAGEHLSGLTITFAGAKYTVKKGEDAFQVGVQKLDPSKSPKTIDVTIIEGLNRELKEQVVSDIHFRLAPGIDPAKAPGVRR